MILRITLLFVLLVYGGCGSQESEKRVALKETGTIQNLEKFDFWTNQDFTWYEQNIPLLETPDTDIDLTYYYRWELTVAHMVYGSTASGYVSTEFIDRPWWSGSYGTIACSLGHQLYEYRWLRNRRYAQDYASYWYNDPGAQVYNYTNWLGDAIWEVYKTYGNEEFTKGLLPDMVNVYQEWENRFYVPEEGMFAWDGMHDGMETNINSRQTEDWFSGAPGYRPTFNAYMWADANAISRIAALNGDIELASRFLKKADTLKTNFQSKNWDADRNFFFHRFKNDERGGIKANTLTYETGKYAGSDHGRELIGYVPWYFNMPDPGYEAAWKYLMDSDYFYAEYGPTVTEQQDPLFKISENCCEWSGNAWPFATSQTLTAMANLLRNYDQDIVTKEDYFKMLRNYALTHRKDGEPYIAEANHPYTGSWDGHDHIGHSEHYFHSSYIDLIISGLIGLQPQATDSIVVDPLIPDDWDYFALENVTYHGHNVSIYWDRTGDKYNKGKGLLIFSDGDKIASAPSVQRLEASIKQKQLAPVDDLVNYAVNNGSAQQYPVVLSSFSGLGDTHYKMLNDGQYWYYTETTTNRWTSVGSENESEYIGIDFGVERPINKIRFYLFGDASDVKTPENYNVEYNSGDSWKALTQTTRSPENPEGNKANTVSFETVNTDAIRIVFPEVKGAVGVSELEAWGPKQNPVIEAPQNPNFLEADVTASFTFSYDDPQTLNDGIRGPIPRWSAIESPNKEDWIQFEFKEELELACADIFIFSDGGNLFPPQKYYAKYWDGAGWKDLEGVSKMPQSPVKGLNKLCFDNVETRKIRIYFEHVPGKFSSAYEVVFKQAENN